jgi:hypothetical protein
MAKKSVDNPTHNRSTLPKGSKLYGPLFTAPSGKSLGASDPAGPMGPIHFSDPLGFIKHGKSGKPDSGKGSKMEPGERA